jgi:hypothetical protein
MSLGGEVNSAQELVRRRRYVHGVRFTGGVVQGLGQDFGQAKAEQQVDGEASGGRATSDSEALQRVVLDYSGVETALEVARVPAGVQREELLLFDLDVTLLPGATSWLSSHSSCQVAEMRIFEPRYAAQSSGSCAVRQAVEPYPNATPTLTNST